MAESEEQLTPVEVDDEEENTQYKAPEKKSVDEILNADAEDESLKKYKLALLGDISDTVVRPDNPNNVILKSMELIEVSSQNVFGKIDLEEDVKDITIEIPEACCFKVKISFYVQREIVSGMIYIQKSYRKGVRVDNTKQMVGSYGPKKEPQVYLSNEDEAPSGMLLRGTYVINSSFTDDDKQIIKEWKWNLKIKKASKDGN